MAKQMTMLKAWRSRCSLIAILAVLYCATTDRANAQIVVLGSYNNTSSGAVQLNPGALANYASTVVPLINPCTTQSGYKGSGCVWPVNSKQWPDPQFSFTVAAPYNTTTYTVEWQMVVKYTDDGKYANSVTVGSTTLPGNQTFSPTFNAQAYGGSAEVQAYVTNARCTFKATGKLTFYIWGSNQDPTIQLKPTVAQYSTSTFGTSIWFLTYLLAQESGGLQFKTKNGHPVWGSPDGIGVSQVDRKVSASYFTVEDPYWNFEVNVKDGLLVLNSKRQNTSAVCSTTTGDVTTACTGTAYNFWDREVYQACSSTTGGSKTPMRSGGIGTEYCNVNIPTPTYPAGSPSIALHCSAAMTWNTSSPLGHWQDFDWIQLYNGAPCGYFLAWSTSSRSWVFKTGACVKGTKTFPNYIVAVCNHTPAY